MSIIAIVADAQVGHQAALWPDGYKNHSLTPAQKVLMSYWKDYWTSKDVKNAEYVINLAESIEGNNRKEAGRSLVDVNLNHQKDAFVELLKPYIRARNTLDLKDRHIIPLWITTWKNKSLWTWAGSSWARLQTSSLKPVM